MVAALGELAMLWDVRILFRDLFNTSSSNVAVMKRLLVLPPVKFLELEIDQLLMGYFWGVGVHQVEIQGEMQACGRNDPRYLDTWWE